MLDRWMHDIARRFAAMLCLALAGCSAGGHVDEQLANPVTLRDSKQAIGLFRLVSFDPSCTSVAVSIGVREGSLFRPQQTLKLQQTMVTNVLEVLLAPGEYHVVGFACYRARSTLMLVEPQGNGLLRRSYASFTIGAGEVVNLGQIRLVRSSRSAGVLTSFHEVTVEVSDWPLSELERFKSQRPKLYAAMRTRLMTLPPSQQPTPENAAVKCAELAKLKADGKLQNVPIACTSAAKPKA